MRPPRSPGGAPDQLQARAAEVLLLCVQGLACPAAPADRVFLVFYAQPAFLGAAFTSAMFRSPGSPRLPRSVVDGSPSPVQLHRAEGAAPQVLRGRGHLPRPLMTSQKAVPARHEVSPAEGT